MEVVFADVVEVVAAYYFAGCFAVVRAQDQDRLAVEGETIHVFDAQAGLCEVFQRFGEIVGRRIRSNRQYVGQISAHIIVSQHLIRLFRLGHNHPEDAILGRVGYGCGDDMDAFVFEQCQYFAQFTVLVFYENGNLIDSHILLFNR